MTSFDEMNNHKFFSGNKDQIENDIDYEKCPPIGVKKWKKRYDLWKKNLGYSKKKKKKDGKTFSPYKRNIFMRFSYDIIKQYVPFPFNCFVISAILLPVFLLPFYVILGVESFFTSDFTVGAFESTTFFIIILLLPLTLVIMEKVYETYYKTFKQLRSICNADKETYQEFIELGNWTFQSPSIRFFTIGAWFIILFLAVNMYLNPKPSDLIDDLGLFGLFNLVLIYSITISIVMNLAWHLFSIVRIMDRFSYMPLEIQPFHPDNAAGLKPLAKLSLWLSSIPLIGVAGILFGILVGQRDIFELQTIIIMICLVFSMIFLFLYPLLRAHVVMERKKDEFMEFINKEHDRSYSIIKNKLKNNQFNIDVNSLTELQGLSELMNQVNNMPTWPFDMHIITSFFGIVVIPIIMMFLPDLLSL